MMTFEQAANAFAAWAEAMTPPLSHAQRAERDWLLAALRTEFDTDTLDWLEPLVLARWHEIRQTLRTNPFGDSALRHKIQL